MFGIKVKQNVAMASATTETMSPILVIIVRTKMSIASITAETALTSIKIAKCVK